MSKYTEVKLDEICSVISGKRLPKGKLVQKERTEYPYIRVKDFSDGSVAVNQVEFIDKETHEKIKKYIIESNDVYISNVGTVGLVGMVPDELSGANLTENAVRLYNFSSKCLPDYLMYYLQSNIGQHEIEINTVGSTQPKLPIYGIKNINVPLPPISVQKEIVSILGAVNKKIKLNQKINDTLEDMALTLYKHLFIDFAPFQNEQFIETELGLIPKGWKIGKLKDFADIIMGQSPKSEYYNLDGIGLPFHQGVKDFENRFPKHSVYCTHELRMANEGDILISVRAPVGRLNIANTRMIIGRGLSAISAREGHQSFLLYTMKNIFAVEDQYGSGTVFNSINKKDVEELKFVLPPSEILETYENKVVLYDELIKSNSKETEELIEVRDYLLPKLLSGEISILNKKTKSEVL